MRPAGGKTSGKPEKSPAFVRFLTCMCAREAIRSERLIFMMRDGVACVAVVILDAGKWGKIIGQALGKTLFFYPITVVDFRGKL